MTARLVVLVSGAGTNLQALLDACGDPAYGATVVAVGADRDGTEGVARAARAGVPAFVVRLADHAERTGFDAAVAAELAAYQPDLVICAGYMKLLGPLVYERFRVLNTHPALLPSFPGAHGVRDALAYGVKVSGASIIFVDGGVDSGPIVAQEAVPVRDDDDERALHERIKVVERRLLVDTVGRLARGAYRIEGRKVVLS